LKLLRTAFSSLCKTFVGDAPTVLFRCC